MSRATTDTTAVRAALDSAVNRYYVARNANDPAAAAGLYGQDAVIMQQGGPDVHGRQGIEAYFRTLPPESGSQKQREVLYVHGDRAYEAWRGSSINTKTGKREYFKWILFWRRDADGRWSVERDLTATDAVPR